jgi:excisionase family DNA binding protein
MASRSETTGRKPRATAAAAPSTGRTRDSPDRLVYTVPEVAKLLGLSRSNAYAAAKRGDFPVIRIGHLVLVPKAAFHAQFGSIAA